MFAKPYNVLSETGLRSTCYSIHMFLIQVPWAHYITGIYSREPNGSECIMSICVTTQCAHGASVSLDPSCDICKTVPRQL